MKIYKKIRDAITWRIILAIDRKYPEACWFNLVGWYIGSTTFSETFGVDSRWNDQSCCEEHGGAYCGKCVRTGRLKE